MASANAPATASTMAPLEVDADDKETTLLYDRKDAGIEERAVHGHGKATTPLDPVEDHQNDIAMVAPTSEPSVTIPAISEKKENVQVFNVGQVCILQNLASQPELNGAHAVVRGYNQAFDRYYTELAGHADGEFRLLKPTCLKKIAKGSVPNDSPLAVREPGLFS